MKYLVATAIGAWLAFWLTSSLYATKPSLSSVDKKPTVLLFGASWCPHCRAMKSELTRIDLSRFDYMYVDVEGTETEKALTDKLTDGKKIPQLIILDRPVGSVSRLIGEQSDSIVRGFLGGN